MMKLALSAVLPLLLLSSLQAQEPWEGQALTGDPQAIAKAAAARPVPKNAFYENLLLEEVVRYDSEGRKTHTQRMVTRCLTFQAAKEYTYLSQTWAPWYQTKPEIKARAISPEGKVQNLDPSAIAEVPLGQIAPDVLSDRKALRATLPSLTTGSVVERVITIKDTKPFFAAGSNFYYPFQVSQPTAVLRLVVDVPVDLPFNYSTQHGMPPVKKQVQGNRMRLTWEQRNLEPMQPEALVPVESQQIPAVTFGPGTSWQAIASAYAQQIDKRCDTLEPIVKQILAEKDSRKEKIEKLVDLVRQRVRYTGIALGESAILPYRPQQVWQRGYGDCKDQSTLLISLLRTAGIEAHPVLVDSGSGSHVFDPKVPGLNSFDHAIVFVPGSPRYWIDPVAKFVPQGELPREIEDAWALVATAEKTKVQRLPKSTEPDRYTEKIELVLDEEQPAQFKQTIQATGSQARQIRQGRATLGPEQTRTSWQQRLQNQWGIEALDNFQMENVQQLDAPIKVQLTAKAPKTMVQVTPYGAVVTFDLITALNTAYDLRQAVVQHYVQTKEADHPSKRKHPMQLVQLQNVEARVKVVPPASMQVRTLPKPEEHTFGPVRISASYQELEDHTVEAIFRYQTGQGRLSAEQADQLLKFVAKVYGLNQQPGGLVQVEFLHQADQAWQNGRVKEAFAEYQRLLAAFPQKATYHWQYARCLVELGFGRLARTYVERGVELDPKSVEAQRSAVYVFVRDDFGRSTTGNFDLQKTLDHSQQVIELQPENLENYFDLAVFSTYNRWGDRFAPSAPFDKGLEALKQAEKQFGARPEISERVGQLLFSAERYQEVVETLDDPQHTFSASLRLAALAAKDDPQTALADLQKLRFEPAERSNIAAWAAEFLRTHRKYPEAKAVLDAAIAQGNAPQEWLGFQQTLSTLKADKSLEQPGETPESIIRYLYSGFFQGGQQLAQVLEKLQIPEKTFDDYNRQVTQVYRSLAQFRRQTRNQTLDSTFWCGDLAHRLKMQTDGDPQTGYRVSMLEAGRATLRWYLRPREQGLQLVLTSPGLPELGEVALEHLDAQRPDAAKKWIDWAYDESKSEVGWFNAFSGDPGPRLWLYGRADPDEDLIRLTAYVLQVFDDQPTEAVQYLEKKLEGKISATNKLQVQRALAMGYIRTDPKKAAHILEELVRRHPRQMEPHLLLCQTYLKLGQLDKIEKLAEQMPQGAELTPFAVECRGILAMERGNWDEVRKQAEQLGENRLLRPNLLVCAALGKRQADEQTLQQARWLQQLYVGHVAHPACLLAGTLVENDQYQEAAQQLAEGLARRGIDRPSPSGWYVRGRMAEKLGLREEAVRSYQQVPPRDKWYDISFYPLAQARLQALNAKGKE